MKKYDVFVSYAIEEKESVAAPVVEGLRRKGLSVYFAGEDLEPGDSISGRIYRGLKNSAYLVPILSHNYVREWTIIEWRHMLEVELEMGNRRLIHPVWHNLTKAEAGALFPALHDHFGLSTADGIERVVARLARKIEKRKFDDWFLKWRKPATLTLVVLVALLVSLGIARMMSQMNAERDHLPSSAEAEGIVRSRIDTYQQEIDIELSDEQLKSNAASMSIDTLRALYNYYNNASDYLPNYYHFMSGYASITGRGNIKNVGITPASTPHTAYGIPFAHISQLKRIKTDTSMELLLVFTDTAATRFVIDTLFYDSRNHEVHMWVNYEHYLRAIYYTMNYSAAEAKLYQHARLLGFKPEEEYIMSNQSGRWELQTVR